MRTDVPGGLNKCCVVLLLRSCSTFYCSLREALRALWRRSISRQTLRKVNLSTTETHTPQPEAPCKSSGKDERVFVNKERPLQPYPCINPLNQNLLTYEYSNCIFFTSILLRVARNAAKSALGENPETIEAARAHYFAARYAAALPTWSPVPAAAPAPRR